MVEKLKLQDFDILGILELKDIQGIEKFVTPIKDEEGRTKSYLSRSKEYYNVKTMSELAICREELQHLLTRECSKRNFVILENMLNCSGKVYFKNFEKYIKYKVQGKDTRNQLIQLIQAQKCLEEDIRNILRDKKKVSFFDLFKVKTREYVVVTFLSILEMAKFGEINIIQENNFNNIVVSLKEGEVNE